LSTALYPADDYSMSKGSPGAWLEIVDPTQAGPLESGHHAPLRSGCFFHDSLLPRN
jgi:hypothetical protein